MGRRARPTTSTATRSGIGSSTKHPGAATALADLAGVLVAPAGRWPASTPGWRPPAASSTGCGRPSPTGAHWFEPDHDIGYPDRVRRREPGAVSKGLAAHADSPSVGGWRIAENQAVFAPLLTGGLDAYDPFDAAHRTGAPRSSRRSGAPCSARSRAGRRSRRCDPVDGVLHVVPIPAAVGYRLVHGLAGELGLLGGEPVPAPRRDAADELLAAGARADPGRRTGRHGVVARRPVPLVGDATNDSRWGNVMYIGAAPRCPRNDVYAADDARPLRRGASPVDFPADDFEVDFDGRATVDDLNDDRVDASCSRSVGGTAD